MTTYLTIFTHPWIPILCFGRIITRHHYFTRSLKGEKSLENLSTALSLQGVPPLLIILALLARKVQMKALAYHGDGERGESDRVYTTETDSKSKTTKFFFAIKINIRSWGLTKTGGRGCQRSCFLDVGLNLM